MTPTATAASRSMSGPMLLLRTVHGSQLYGTAHAGSDIDIYEVHDYCDNRQVITKNLDITRVSLSKFLLLCDKGVPQALEAMFSPLATTDVLADYRRAYRPNIPNARETYARTIKNFALSDKPKAQRHARRLARNLSDLERYGRFNPMVYVA